tara:strand:+ start:118 stop:420 length:303 start_codon:yes stop_codon:yes gene_type:complete
VKTEDTILISALRILATEIQSGDGVANACIAEAANRLEELTATLKPDPGDGYELLPTGTELAYGDEFLCHSYWERTGQPGDIVGVGPRENIFYRRKKATP